MNNINTKDKSNINDSQKNKSIRANDDLLIFNTDAFDNPESDLVGTLRATVKFAQSQIIPYRTKKNDIQPHLTSLRNTLLLVTPKTVIENLSVVIKNAENGASFSLGLNSPDELPATVYNISDRYKDIYTINNNAELEFLNDPEGAYLKKKLENNTLVDIETSNGNWIDEIYLPQNTVTGKVIKISSWAAYNSTIFYNNSKVTLTTGKSELFIFSSGEWSRASEQINQSLIYAENTWSVIIPRKYIRPGITMYFTSGDLNGVLNDIKIGAASEILINTIDIGMLTPPRGALTFAYDTKTHREYFQTVPAARLVVNNYQALHLTEVMLPTGTLLTDYDPSHGDWHSGTMRQEIAKVLISLGINCANYGINSSKTVNHSIHLASQMTVHNSVGKYANGVIIHGGSGGSGMVTLEYTVGNEFSHEMGHNYGLGHYPGGFEGSVHRSADENNSMWGWDMDLNLFIPNFSSVVTNKSTCLDGRCQPPFYGHAFGFDPMSGGEPMTSLIRYTLHTPYTASITQQSLESKIHFDSTSQTGFSKWDSTRQAMRPYTHRVNRVTPTEGPYENVTKDVLSALFVHGRYVIISMQDGAWSKDIQVPQASSDNKGCILEINHRATYSSILYINGTTITVNRGFRRDYQSDGNIWNEVILIDSTQTRDTLPKYDRQVLNESVMKETLVKYDYVEITIADNWWSELVHMPPAEPSNAGHIMVINHDADYNTNLYINELNILISKGNKRYFISDGTTWKENASFVDLSEIRKPQAFGVPVTTLVGYYDPEGILTHYIYPALHGAYGYIYPDNRTIVTDSDWQLWVETGNETLRFLLDNNRLDQGLMNKFHINIPESEQTRTAYLVHNGVKLLSKTIEPASTAPFYTVNG